MKILSTSSYDPYSDDEGNNITFMPDIDSFASNEDYDKYLTAEVLFLNKDGTRRKGTVSNRKRDAHGNPVGSSHSNPMLDTSV